MILSWHVSYWDYLGWKDKFARKEFTERQRRYVATGNVKGLVTPQFMLNNAPVSEIADLPKLIDRASAKRADYDLNASASIHAGTIDAAITLKEVAATTALKPSTQILPLLVLNRATTQPAAGENRGAALVERFIVVQAATPIPAANAGALPMKARFDAPKDIDPAELRVVLLLEDAQNQATLECISVPVSAK